MSQSLDFLTLLRKAGCFDFLMRYGREASGEVRSGAPITAALYAPEAWDSIAKCYVRRVERVYLGTLIMRVYDVVRRHDIIKAVAMSADDEDLWASSARQVARELGEDAHAELVRESPLIEDYVRRIRTNFIDAQVELAQRLGAQSTRIAETILDGVRVGRVLRIEADGGEPHRHGRAVHRIVAEGGSFFYKPHDCTTDRLYARMVDAWFADCTKVPHIVTGDGYAFVEELVRADVVSEHEIATYYERIGNLTALFYAIGSSDMHTENFIACGSYPCAVDLETLFGCNVSRVQQEVQEGMFPGYDAMSAYDSSVVQTSILPVWLHLAGTFSPLCFTSESLPNEALPRLRGKPMSVEGFEGDFRRGFEDGYYRILKHRDDLLGIIGEYGNVSIRSVLRNTLYYDIMRQLLYRKESLADEAARDECLRKLNAPFRLVQADDIVQRVIDYEKECLLEGDIPYYCIRLMDSTLCGNDDDQVIVSGIYKRTPYAVLHERLDALGEGDLRFELDVIRAKLAHAAQFCTEASDDAGNPSDVALTSAKARQLCSELLEEAWADRLVTVDGVLIWHSGLLEIEHRGGMGLDARQQDVLWYCARILASEPLRALHGRAKAIGRMCLDATLARVAGYVAFAQDSEELVAGTGIRYGIGSLVASCAQACAAGLDGAREALLDAVQYLSYVQNSTESSNEEKLSNEAELVLALVAAADAVGMGEEACSSIRAALRRWVGSLVVFDEPKAPLQMALLGAALAGAFHVLGDDTIFERASRLFVAVQELYSPEHCSWPLEVGPFSSARGWGNASSIGLLALWSAQWAPGIRDAHEVARLACAGVRRQGVMSRDSLNEGNASAALLLVRMSRLDADASYLADAGRILATVERRREERGYLACSPAGISHFFDVLLCDGALGVGYAVVEYVEAVESGESLEGRES